MNREWSPCDGNARFQGGTGPPRTIVSTPRLHRTRGHSALDVRSAGIFSSAALPVLLPNDNTSRRLSSPKVRRLSAFAWMPYLSFVACPIPQAHFTSEPDRRTR